MMVRRSNLFYVKSVGSMLALDSPYIANFAHNNHEEHIATGQVYLVPIAQHEEKPWSLMEWKGSRICPIQQTEHILFLNILLQNL